MTSSEVSITAGPRADHHDDVYEGPAFRIETESASTLVRSKISGLHRALLPKVSDEQLDRALTSILLRRIQELHSDQEVVPFEVHDDDVEAIVEFLRSPKACDERVDDGKRLTCEAEPSPTSPQQCNGCERPDERFICSHFRNPRVETATDGHSQTKKTLRDATCATSAGRAGAGCVPWRNECWQRLEPELPRFERNGALSATWESEYKFVGEPIHDAGSALVQRVHRLADGNEDLVLKAAHEDDHGARQRFEREIEVLHRITHANVMPIVDSSLGQLWYIMPLAQTDHLRPDPDMPSDVLFSAVSSIAKGLAAGHELDFVHRDLKPSNVLWLDGNLVVADWGIARNPRGTTRSFQPTATDLPYGSEGWAAPEQSRGAHEVTAAADIYSLGQVVGWLLTGQAPEQNIPLTPVHSEWGTVVKTFTALDPDARPQTIEDAMDFIVNTVSLHAESELFAEVVARAQPTKVGRVPLDVEVHQAAGYTVFEVRYAPDDLKINFVEDHRRYGDFVREFPGELKRTYPGRPPTTLPEWPKSRMLKFLENLDPNDVND